MLKKFLLTLILLFIPITSYAQVTFAVPNLPTTCAAGDTYFITVPPRSYFDCVATNIFKQQGENLLIIKAVNLNSVADTIVPLPPGLANVARYMVTKVTATNASTTLAASVCQAGVYTAAAKGGTAVVAVAANLTGLTAASKFTNLTVAVSADTLTAMTLYLRIDVAHGAPATADFYIRYEPVL